MNMPGARVYRLVTRDSSEDSYAKKEESKKESGSFDCRRTAGGKGTLGKLVLQLQIEVSCCPQLSEFVLELMVGFGV